MKLKLGVLDLPYADSASYAEAGVRRRGKKANKKGSITTGEVADILESRYHIMDFFFEKHGEEIGDQIAESYEKAFEAIEMGAPPTLDPLGSAAQKIESSFREMLTNRELDGQVAGVPTKASKGGVSKRRKRPYAKRKSRPSFIDTGLYESSFRVWKEDEE